MRAIRRIPLAAHSSSWLAQQQGQIDVDPTIDLSVRWSARRQTMTNNGVLVALKEMSGYRERCMYCGDSQGCDIEHFWPKSTYRSSAFLWSNFLWICQPCNRRKSKNFPVSHAGDPLIIDPSLVDPWVYFTFIEETGEIVPRVDLVGENAIKAAYTVDPRYTRLNIECVAEGRRRDSRTLRRAGGEFVAQNGTAMAEKLFIEAATDLDHPEITQWFLTKDGALVAPFNQILIIFPFVVRNALRALSWCHPGL